MVPRSFKPTAVLYHRHREAVKQFREQEAQVLPA
jgi:hypothetical protein